MVRQRAPAVIASFAVALLFLLAVGVPPALASTEVFDFTSCHVSGGCGTAPFGSVTLTQVGTSVDVSVVLTDAEFVKTGSGGQEAFKFVGLPSTTTITNTDITITSPPTPTLVADGPGSFDGDGTGNFAFGIRCPSCGIGGAGAFSGPIDFTVANATISQLTVANSPQGFVFVADVLFTSGSAMGNTGPIDASTGHFVAPEASSVTVLSLMLLAFGALAFRARRELV